MSPASDDGPPVTVELRRDSSGLERRASIVEKILGWVINLYVLCV